MTTILFLLIMFYPAGFLLTAILYIENDIVANPLLIICWPLGLVQFIHKKIKNNQYNKLTNKRDIVNFVLTEI